MGALSWKLAHNHFMKTISRLALVFVLCVLAGFAAGRLGAQAVMGPMFGSGNAENHYSQDVAIWQSLGVGGVVWAGGIAGHAGRHGTYSNAMNLSWDGSCVSLWVDDYRVGCITVH